MAFLVYYGELWGYQVRGEEGKSIQLCKACYEKANSEKKVKAEQALGTEDRDEDEPAETSKKYLYECDECGKVSV